MDDGYLTWHEDMNVELLFKCLNNLDPSIKFTYKKDRIYYDENNTNTRT